MKQRKISKTNVVNFSTYLGMVIFFLVMTALSKAGVLNRSMTGLLVPICCYMSMAVSLNLTVGILGELSLGHAGFNYRFHLGAPLLGNLVDLGSSSD